MACDMRGALTKIVLGIKAMDITQRFLLLRG
jgi:hypothetical protein